MIPAKGVEGVFVFSLHLNALLENRRLFMSQLWPYFKPSIIVVLFFFIAGLTMSCGATPAPIPSPRPIHERGQVAVIPPPTPTIPPSPTSPPVLLEPDDGCVSCHTNQEQLIATADEEEVAEELSEGEG
jgi:hypothetical protein